MESHVRLVLKKNDLNMEKNEIKLWEQIKVWDRHRQRGGEIDCHRERIEDMHTHTRAGMG